MGNPITVNLSELDSSGGLSVPLEELEPSQPKPKTPRISFDTLYGKPTTAPGLFGTPPALPAARSTPTEAAARISEPHLNLAPPEHPQPQSEYWTSEYAARQRDVEKITQAQQRQQQRESEARERHAEIAKQPFDTRFMQSMLEPGTTLGTVLAQQTPKEPGLELESDWFKHRASEAAAQGKSVWDAFPHSITEALIRSMAMNRNMPAEQARRIAEPLTQPLVDLPTATGHSGEPFVAGAERAIGGFTSPENLALLGTLGELEAAAQSSTGLLRHAPRVVSGLFATQMGAGLVQSARDYQSARAAGDTETAQRILGSALVQAPLTLLTAYHASAGRAGAPVRAEELLDSVHAADTATRMSEAGTAATPARETPVATQTAPGTVSVPLEGLKPARSARAQVERVPTSLFPELEPQTESVAPGATKSIEALQRSIADQSLPAGVREAARAELDRITTPRPEGAPPTRTSEFKPPELRTIEKVEASPYQRQQAQLYVNRIRDIYTREYAQSYLNANLEGTLEPERGSLSPLDAAAIRRSVDDNLAKQPRVPVAQKYPADVLEEAQAELRAAHDLASSFERPGRYHADLGPEYGAREQDKAWYGISSSRGMVADQFPWYSEESITPANLADAATRGKGANYERIVDRIADHIQAQREEVAPILEEFGPQLESLAAQIHDVDPELAQNLLDIRSGRYASIRNLRDYVAGKVQDATAAAQFSNAFDQLANEETRDAVSESVSEAAPAYGEPREAGGREEAPRSELTPLEVPLAELTPVEVMPRPSMSEWLRNQSKGLPPGEMPRIEGPANLLERIQHFKQNVTNLEDRLREEMQAGDHENAAQTRSELEEEREFLREALKGVQTQEPEAILPGMAGAVEEQRHAALREQGRQAGEEFNRPRGDIEEAAGRMERESPLFRGTEASPQKEIFDQAALKAAKQPSPGDAEYEALKNRITQSEAHKRIPSEREAASSAASLRKSADALTAQIEAKRNPAVSNQNPTARRARIAEGMWQDAERLQRIQDALHGMADAIENGELPGELRNVRSRALVESLLDRKELPRPYLHNSYIRDLIDKTAGYPNTAQDRALISRVSRGENGAHLQTREQIEAAERLMDVADKRGVNTKFMRDSLSDGKRAMNAGFDTPEKWAAAREKILQYQGEQKAAGPEQAIRRAERELIGIKIPGYFPTPKTAATDLVERADIKPGMSVLEPSAGKGNIADAVREAVPDANLATIEPQTKLREILELKKHSVVGRDFLEHDGQYDRIVMNPPFENGQDIDHVRHAYDLLKPGGKLVSIMSEGPFFRGDRRAAEFREWLDRVGGTSEKLEPGSFTGAEAERQTGTATRVVEVEKPEGAQSARTPERDYEDVGKHLGIEYRGVMGADMGLGDKAVVIYQDPESKTSIGVKVGEWSPERLQEKLEEARASMAGDPLGGTMYSGLGFLDPELIRRVMPESIKNALSENISLGEREAGIVREKSGELARKKEQVFQQYADAMARWEKRPIQEGRDFILREQRGQRQPNTQDQAVADALQREFASRRAAVEDLTHGSFDHWREHYFPQFWERPNQVADWVKQRILGGRRPLQGPAGFRKTRVFDDLQEGLDAGFKPITNNPVSMALLKLHEMDRYVMAHQILGQSLKEGLAKFVRFGEAPPAGWTRVNDSMFRVLQRSEEAQGMVLRGEYYMPAEAARVLNNYLAPGLRGNPLYDVFRGAGNTLNQAQLGFSAFHAMFSALNSSISDFALALRKASRFNLLEAAQAGMRSATLVTSPVRHVVEGRKLMKEYLSPGTYAQYSELADAVAKGGGRIYQDPFYRNAALTKFWKAWGEGDWKRVGLQAFPAALEKMAQPVMEHLVPRLKLGAFADIARESLDRLPPGASKAQIRAALDHAWDSIDNRFGQVVYDNLFINKAVKDLGLIGVRSLGWNLGTVRELGGAGKDILKAAGRAITGEKPRFTDRMAYTMALPIVTGYIGALVNYAYTGQAPQELKDYFFPRTGRTLPNGEPERISIPTYMKDVFAFAKHPLVTASHKVHPLLAMIADILRNQDFYNVEIRHPDDPLVKQAWQLANYVAEQFSPLSYRNLAQRARAEGRPGVKGALREAISPAGLESFVGITPAPSSVTHTAAEEKAIEILNRRAPQGTRTSDEFTRGLRHSYLRGEVAAGRMKPEDLAQRVRAGEITPKEAGDILKQTREAPIVHYSRSLPIEDFLQVWELANQREREQLRPLLLTKRHLVANLPANERAAVAQRLSEALKQSEAPPVTVPPGFVKRLLRQSSVQMQP